MKPSLSALCLCAALHALACGSDDGRRVAVVDPDAGAAGNGGRYTGGLPTGPGSGPGSKPEVTTDIESDALLSSLSSDDAVKLCQAVIKAADSGFSEERSVRLTCYVFALAEGTLEDGTLDEPWCELNFDNCLSEIKRTSSTSCDKDSITAQFAACNASVGDLEDCIEQSAAELRRLLEGLTCNDSSNAAVDKFLDSPRPEPCQAVGAQCPFLDLSRTSEMGLMPSPTGCDNNCSFARDGLCDDGGPGSKLSLCGLGTDCDDCGRR